MKINLGCGYDHKEGFTNIDILEEVKPDIVLDITKENFPFEDNSVDLIYSRHTFEHLTNFDHIFKEMYRVLKDKGMIHIIVPYATSLGGDYEFHTIRCRYQVFSSYDTKGKTMNKEQRMFKARRYLRFQRPLFIIEFLLNHFPSLIVLYENTFLRYLFPALEVIIEMEK